MPTNYHFASSKYNGSFKKEPHIHNKTAALVLENGEILWGYGLGEKRLRR